ncbi:hypothetical protein BASA83_001099 [Batrachochytrium salamandrivorans]|nr:hypothetical protein BASA62_002261 [Batrachochytrium salamandrivorans]KAH9276406.1 hypothetical protein BASA83_001099 [Batrachochytrium salamandrivorans]
MSDSLGVVESPVSGVEQLLLQQQHKQHSKPPQLGMVERKIGEIYSNESSFRDLMMFEERLRCNIVRIRGATFRWKVFLAILLVLLVGSAYVSYNAESPIFDPDVDSHSRPPHTPWSVLVFVCTCSVTLLFFASGMYRSKLLTPATFVARCNRTLKPFNMSFQESSGQIVFTRKIPKEIQDGMQTYRTSFRRRREQSAARRRTVSGGTWRKPL